MSEYWKSTPRIYCKHCKQYYRDTPLDTTNHNQSPKHQSSVQRSIRKLHTANEREARESQRAKDEVARLDGVVSGRKPPEGKSYVPKQTASAYTGTSVLSEGDRKRQMAQLAAMGVAVPEEFRKELAVAGDWTTVSTKRIDAASTANSRGVEGEDGAKAEDNAADQAEWEKSYGVRKRGVDEEDGGGTGFKVRRKAREEDMGPVDIRSLMGRKLPEVKTEPPAVKKEESTGDRGHEEAGTEDVTVKKEDDEKDAAVPKLEGTSAKEGGAGAEAPVFKKRKKMKVPA